METSLEDALNGVQSEPETVETPQVETPQEPEAKADGPARDESGRFAPKTDEKGVETPAEPEAEQQDAVPPTDNGLPKEEYTALRAVRDENKELKQQMAALQQRFASQGQKQQPPGEVPDFWEDPNAAFDTRLQQFGSTLMQQFEQRQQVQRIEASEASAKAKYADYGDAFTHFQQAASVNPGLVQQMQVATDPAEFAYKTGKRVMELEQVGSLDSLLAQERAKWEAEAKAAIKPAQQFPSTTATDGSVGSRKGPEWSGPTDLNSLLP